MSVFFARVLTPTRRQQCSSAGEQGGQPDTLRAEQLEQLVTFGSLT